MEINVELTEEHIGVSTAYGLIKTNTQKLKAINAPGSLPVMKGVS